MISLKKNLGKLCRATSIAAAVSVLSLGTMTTEAKRLRYYSNAGTSSSNTVLGR